MKHGKILLSAILAIGAVSTVVVMLHREGDPVKPAAWILDAAVALNRDAIMAGGHGAAEQPAVAANPSFGAAHAGEQLRIQRRFTEAAAAFREAVEANPLDADSWADLADCEAMAAGHDLSAGREAIMRALRIDPRHRKALWLRASLELQEQKYGAAAATWRELRALVPAGSGDARIIDANIAEADALASGADVAAARSSS